MSFRFFYSMIVLVGSANGLRAQVQSQIGPQSPSNSDGGFAEVHVLRGHKGAAFGVAVAPDGQRAFSTGLDGTIRTWDLSTGKELLAIQAHKDWAVGLGLSSDGKRAVTTGNDRSIKLWDLITGQEIRRYEGHENYVWTAMISSNGIHILSGGHDKTSRLWNLETGREVKRFEGTRQVWDATFSPDGKRILLPDSNEAVRLLDAATGQEVLALKANKVISVAISGDGRRALTGGGDKLLILWDLANGNMIRKFEGHTAAVRFVAFSPNGKRIATSGYDKTVRLWNAETGQQLARFDWPLVKGFLMFGVAFTPDGRNIVAAGGDGDLRVLRIAPKLLDANDGPRSIPTQPEEKFAVSDRDLLQGTWVCDTAKEDGKDSPKFLGIRAVIDGDRLTWHYPKKEGGYLLKAYEFRLDPTRQHFDLFRGKSPDKVFARLYNVGRDEIQWSTNLSDTRPATWETGKFQFTMKRAREEFPLGTALDLDGDCTLRLDEGKVRIQIPPGHHDLYCGSKNAARLFNAPRLLRSVEGDFTVQVKVTSDWKLGPDLSTRRAFNGAGLFIWDSEKQYLRLERTQFVHRTLKTPHWYITPLYDLNDTRLSGTFTDREFFKGSSTWLRIERTGQTITSSISHDGREWTKVGEQETQFPRRVQIGLHAMNGAEAAFAVEFDQFEFRQRAPKTSDAGGGRDAEANPAAIELTAGASSTSVPLVAVNPNRDCEIRTEKGRISIKTPSGRHDLYFGGKDPTVRYNAPRVLREVEGDFTAQVKVTSALTGPGRFYLGAGLLVWDSENQYLRFERNRFIHSKFGTPHSFSSLLYDTNGKRVREPNLTDREYFQGRSTWLRLERRGSTITTAISHDGVRWLDGESLATKFPRRVRVGVVAISISTQDFIAIFDDLEIRRK